MRYNLGRVLTTAGILAVKDRVLDFVFCPDLASLSETRKTKSPRSASTHRYGMSCCVVQLHAIMQAIFRGLRCKVLVQKFFSHRQKWMATRCTHIPQFIHKKFYLRESFVRIRFVYELWKFDMWLRGLWSKSLRSRRQEFCWGEGRSASFPLLWQLCAALFLCCSIRRIQRGSLKLVACEKHTQRYSDKKVSATDTRRTITATGIFSGSGRKSKHRKTSKLSLLVCSSSSIPSA